MINSLVLYSNGFDDALAHLRVVGPTKHLGLKVVRGVVNGKVYPNRVSNADVVVIQRDYPGNLQDYEEILALAHANRKPVILDIDDLLFDLPVDHPDRQSHHFAGALLPTFQAALEADLVTVSTAGLRRYLLHYNKNVVLLPNCFDDSLWNLRPPSRNRHAEGRLVIGYMGGHTHAPDVKLLVPVLLEINRRYRRKIEFHFWGIKPPARLASLTNVHSSPISIGRYAEFAAYFQTQSADIFVAPLGDNAFNASKSPVKYFEYSALGAPGVYSRMEPYSSVVVSGRNGFLASSPEEWIDALSALIEDPALRSAVAAHAQTAIRSKWLLSRNAARWAKAYGAARAQIRKGRRPASPLSRLIRSLSHQVTDERKVRDHALELLESEGAAKTRVLQSLTDDLVEKERSRQALQTRVTEQDRAVQTLSAQLADERRSVEALTDQVGNTERQAQALSAQLAEKERLVQALQSEVSQKAQAEQNLSAEVARLQFDLTDLRSGAAFALLNRYRRLVEQGLPYGTRRRRLYNQLLKAVGLLLTQGPVPLWRKIAERQRTTFKLRWVIAPLYQKVQRLGKAVNPIPLISVVIPIYDRTEVLRQSIDSILGQTHGNLELLLVCDGSPPATLEVVRYYERADSRVRAFYFGNNSGNAVRGRNKGIKEARGAFLAFQDSDDIAEPDRLACSLEALQTYDAHVVYGGWRALVEGRPIDLTNGQEVYSPECDLELLREVCVPCQSTVMARIECLRDVGGFKDRMRYREDHELWARLAYYGYRFKSIHRVLTNLRLHPGNLELAFKGDDAHWRAEMQMEYMKKRPMKPKIGYVIPGTGIGGGVAVVCQHANRLLLRGYDAALIAEDNHDCIPWYPDQLCEVVPLNRAADNYDILVATGWSTAYSVAQMPAPRKCYFVQSDERRFFTAGDKNVASASHTYTMDFEFLTMAKWLQRWLADEFGKAPIYVPNGLDPRIIHPADPVAAKGPRVRVLLEGPIDIPFKGMEDAFVAVQGLDCEIWCVSSSGRPRPEWKCDRFFEKVSFGEMKHIYSSCDILLKMSRVESFAYPPLEMMACGGAVIVGRVTGIEEYAIDGYNALVVEQGDVIAARAAVKRLIEDATLRSRLSQNGIATAKQWRWEPTIDKLEHVFYPAAVED